MSDQELLNLIRQYFTSGYGANTGGGVNALADGQYNPQTGGTITPSSFSYTPGGDMRGEFLRNTPGYQFAFGEGLRGLQSSAAARGTLLTGGTLRGIQRFGTGLADQLYGNTVNRYADLAKLGQQTAVAQF